jgi:hypothetical protein
MAGTADAYGAPPGSRPPTSAAATSAELRPTPAEAAVVVHGDVSGQVIGRNDGIAVHTNLGSIVQNKTDPVRRRLPLAAPPAKPEPFLARDDELRRLADLKPGRGATISGPAGAGKSTLLRAAAGRTPGWDTVIRVDAIGRDGADLSVNDVAQLIHDGAWECVPHFEVDATSARSALAGIAALALVDHTQLWGDDVERLADLLPTGTVLIATRNSPANSPIEDVRLGALPRAAACALLALRAHLPIAQPSSGEPIDPNLDAIADLLADWPGALMVAGRAIRDRSSTLAAALAELGAVTPQASDRFGAAIERAWALAEPALDPNARRLLITAASLPGGPHDPDVLRRVLGNPPWFDAAATALLDAGLLTRNSPRLRVADGLRDVIADRESAEGDVVEAADRLVSDVTARAKERILDPSLDPAELGEQLGAFHHAVRAGRHDAAAGLARLIAPRLVLNGLWDAWQAVAQGARAAASQVADAGTVAWATHELGTRELAVGNRSEARRLLTEALRMRRRLGDVEGAAYTLHNLRRITPVPWWGDGGNLGRLLLGGATLGIALLLVVVLAPAVAGLIWPNPTPSPSATPSSAASTIASPTPPPSLSPSPPVSPIQLVSELSAYEFSGRDWTTELQITVSGGQGDYLVSLDGIGESKDNPSTFKLVGRDCERYTVRGTATSAGEGATPISIDVGPDACPTEPPVFEMACVTFDDIPIGTVYGEPAGDKPGDEIYKTAEGIRVIVHDFLYSDVGGTFNAADVQAPNPEIGSDTPSVFFNNINFEFDFSELGYEPRRVTFDFRDQGGNQNLSVNGSEVHRELLTNAPSPIGGVSLELGDVDGNGWAAGSLEGAVDRFLIGGQELTVDTVCAHP